MPQRPNVPIFLIQIVFMATVEHPKHLQIDPKFDDDDDDGDDDDFFFS